MNSQPNSLKAECAWKPNWEETKGHFVDWWNHRGLVFGMLWSAPRADLPRQGIPKVERPASIVEAYTDIDRRVQRNHFELSQCAFPADTLPLAHTDMGAGVLGTFLGSEPNFTPETVWFSTTMAEVEDPEKLPTLRFDPENRWWKFMEEFLRKSREIAGNDYLVPCPDLIENGDVLAVLRDSQTLLVDMIERPDWVKLKLKEINQAWFEAYNRIYDLIKLSDGSSAFWAFSLWGPGKTAKVQCDMAAMISPEMFGEFIRPVLAEQAEWLDYSMYHLDGTQAICHLDHLLGIDALDAIEWTPQAGLEQGGSPRWFDLYRRILNAGKSVMAVGVAPKEVVPLLDAIGGKGVCVTTWFENERQAEQLAAQVEQFR